MVCSPFGVLWVMPHSVVELNLQHVGQASSTKSEIRFFGGKGIHTPLKGMKDRFMS